LELRDGAIPLFEGVRVPDPRTADMHLAGDGTVLYVEGSAVASGPPGAQLVVVDLEGNREVLPLSPRPMQGVTWSPDGESVAFGSEGHVYTYDVVRNTTPRQITFEGTNGAPVYSPDGTRLAFWSLPAMSTPTGLDLFVKELEDDSPPTLIASLDRHQVPMQWPTDTLIAFLDGSTSDGPWDLWTLDLSDPQSPEARPYLTSEANLAPIAISPDGTLAAYASDETGSNDVYVRSFPNPGERTVVSRGGGRVAWWSPDGMTLYFGALRGLSITMVAARLSRGPALTVLSTDTLFTVDGITGRLGANALHPDGDRFVFALSPLFTSSISSTGAVEAATQQRVILVQNFFAELLERVGEAR
jgi:Tol biopolymer transport system component